MEQKDPNAYKSDPQHYLTGVTALDQRGGESPT